MKQEYKSIAEFGKIITGKTPSTKNKEYWNGTIPFITPTDIEGYDMHYIFNTERSITNIGADTQKKTILPPNAICVSCIASIGKMCLTSAKQSITNQQINSIIVNENYDYRYIFYLLRFFLPYIQLIGGGTGSGTPIISKNKFSKFKYPISGDLHLQKRVADILAIYDELIENNNKRIKILEQMAENLYKEWFVRFRFPGHETTPLENGIPKGWSIAPFSQNADVMSGGTPSTDNPNYYDGCIPFFTPKDCDDSFFVFETITNITEDGLNHCNSQLYPENTIAITARGTVGNVALFACPMAMNQSCFALKSDKLNNQFYLFFAIKNEVLKLKKMANGGVFDTIVVKSFDHIPLTIPSEDVLKKFECLITPIMKAIREIQISSNNLIKQRDLLLPRLMSGKLAV